MKRFRIIALFISIMTVCLLLTACGSHYYVLTAGGSHYYGYTSEFENGFAFVREQAVRGISLETKTYNSSYHEFFGSFSESTLEEANKIAEENRRGYKFIDKGGNILFDNLDADVYAYSNSGSITEPGGFCYIAFKPSYFTDYGMAVVNRDRKFGIINTSGNILCDFIYDGIEMYDENIAIIKTDDMKRLYYIHSGRKSEFAASFINPLKDGFFSFYIVNGNSMGLPESTGVVDAYGNLILPDRYLVTLEQYGLVLEGHDEVAYIFRGDNAPNSPPTTFYNRNFEVVDVKEY